MTKRERIFRWLSQWFRTRQWVVESSWVVEFSRGTDVWVPLHKDLNTLTEAIDMLNLFSEVTSKGIWAFRLRNVYTDELIPHELFL